MDIDQIRAAMLVSASLPERLDALRRERVARILANEGPHPLRLGVIMLFHVVPFASLSRTVRIDPSELKKLSMQTISMGGGGSPRFNFDGYLFSATNGYVQAFRSGVIESVMAQLSKDGKDDDIASVWFENTLIDSVGATLSGLPTIGVMPPYYVGITFARVKNVRLATSGGSLGPIDRDVLFLPEVQIDQAVLASQQVAAALRPAFDAVWQSAGAERSPNFDERGKWNKD